MEHSLIEIVKPQSKRIFSLKMADDLLPLIYRLTEESSKLAKYLVSCLEALPNKNSQRALEIQEEINVIIAKWQNKMERLGVRPKGMWLVDFDYGQGYFCWKFPETKISYFHGYQDGFTGRKILALEELKPNENSNQSN